MNKRIENDTDRAQPGDVLGIERDGERTHLGEDREDEDARRLAAEEELADEDDDDDDDDAEA